MPQVASGPPDPVAASRPDADVGSHAAADAQPAEEADRTAQDGGWSQSATAPNDLLDRICPYLLSEDGTYRSSEPDPRHRCTAQDPPSSLPSAFQERFCLSERHVRCEMFKVAQAARSAALGQSGGSSEQVRSARFKPSVRSVPLALGPASGAPSAGGAGSRRPLILAAVGVGGLAVLIFALVLLLGGGGSGPPANASPSPSSGAHASTEPEHSARPTQVEPTPGISASDRSEASVAPAASDAAAADRLLIEYEVQPGEALIAIAEAFGTSRRDILLANPGMEEQKPHTEPGKVIIVPVSAALTREAIEAVPGFVRFVE